MTACFSVMEEIAENLDNQSAVVLPSHLRVEVEINASWIPEL
jgi:hypothetical protein